MSGDNAISSSAEDRLGRSAFASHLASALLAEPAEHGLVAALVGPWGQGKSSVLNMVREELEGTHSRTVLTFNPWMFAGREQLVSTFFEQVAGQLRLKGSVEQALADRLLGYGQALSPLVWVPVAGSWLGRAGSIASAISQARKSRSQQDPVEQQRQAIESALARLADPIFVMIDDIDRLTGPEIRDMLGLVRLTAHFPKIIYLLAFDRVKVERALAQDGLEDGRGYLDKIVELSFDLPATSMPALRNLFISELAQILDGIVTGPFDSGRWPDVLARVILPLLGTPRDVNRYLAALPASLRMIGDEVALVDVLALEAVRLRLPDVFTQLGPMSPALTDLGMLTSQAPGWQDEVNALVGSAGDQATVVTELCRLLFPATERYLGSNTTYPSNWRSTWRRNRQVASLDVLGIYLVRQLPPGAVPAATVEMAVVAMRHKDAFQALVDNMSAEDLDDLIARLAAYEDDIAPDAVLPACTVLLGLYSRLRTSSLGFLDPGPEWGVDRLIQMLLRRVDDIAERTRLVEKLCTTASGFTGRIRMLHLAGRRPNPEADRLIPAADSDRLFRQTCHEIRHASAAQIVAEREPLQLIATALVEDPADRDNIDRILGDDDAAAAVLLSSTAQVRGQAVGSVAMQAEQVLLWQALATVVGDDKAIAALVDRVAAARSGDNTAITVVALARQYLTGWRPLPSPFSAREPVRRQALNHPHTFFSPSMIDGGWPALLLRAVTTYEVDPAWAAQADVSGTEFHNRLTAFLTSIPLPSQVGALAGKRDLPHDSSGWTHDKDAYKSRLTAVQRLTLGAADQLAAVLRYAVFLPDNTGPMRLIADIALSPGEATDAKWGKLSLEEARDLLATALDAAGSTSAGQMLGSIYSGEIPPRTAVELYLWSGHGQSGGRASSTIDNMIDLEPLGPPTRPDQAVAQGMFAASGDTPTATIQDRLHLVTYAMIRMAIDWGYIDARARLVSLASS